VTFAAHRGICPGGRRGYRHNCCVPGTHTTNALANPAQPHHALVRELERYIEAHNPDLTDVNVLSATDTGRADKSHKPVRHWYHVTYEA
jgi:RNA-splicing ligase RtcB